MTGFSRGRLPRTAESGFRVSLRASNLRPGAVQTSNTECHLAGYLSAGELLRLRTVEQLFTDVADPAAYKRTP